MADSLKGEVTEAVVTHLTEVVPTQPTGPNAGREVVIHHRGADIGDFRIEHSTDIDKPEAKEIELSQAGDGNRGRMTVILKSSGEIEVDNGGATGHYQNEQLRKQITDKVGEVIKDGRFSLKEATETIQPLIRTAVESAPKLIVSP